MTELYEEVKEESEIFVGHTVDDKLAFNEIKSAAIIRVTIIMALSTARYLYSAFK